MAKQTVIVSDLSGKMAQDESPVTVRVLDHPELGGAPVELDVLESELPSITDNAKDFVLIEVRRGDQAAVRYALAAEDFDNVSERPMAEILKQAPIVYEAPEPRRRGRPRGSGTSTKPERDYNVAAVKKWADSQGKDYPKRGRLPQSLVDEFKAAGN